MALYGLPYTKFDLDDAANIWRQQHSLHEILDGRFTLHVDDFVIDKHTHKRRVPGKGVKEFVDDGVIVIPQDPAYYSSDLETIYRTR